jgi:hypothetical protein
MSRHSLLTFLDQTTLDRVDFLMSLSEILKQPNDVLIDTDVLNDISDVQRSRHARSQPGHHFVRTPTSERLQRHQPKDTLREGDPTFPVRRMVRHETANDTIHGPM